MVQDLTTLRGQALQRACRSILLGHDRELELATAGERFDIERIYAAYQKPHQTDWRRNVIEAMLAACEDIQKRSQSPSPSESDRASELLCNWLTLAELIRSPSLHETCTNLLDSFLSRRENVDTIANLAARAVSSTFSTTQEGVEYWLAHLSASPVHGYALKYLIRHDARSDTVVPTLGKIFVASALGYTSVAPEFLLQDLILQRTHNAPENQVAEIRQDALISVFREIPRQYYSAVRERLMLKSWSAAWIPVLDSCENDALAPELQQFLERIKVRPSDFSSAESAGHPVEIGWAIDQYKQRWKTLLPISLSETIAVTRFDYPPFLGIENISKGHRAFLDRLKHMASTYGSVGTVPSNLDDVGANTAFISQLDSRRSLTEKILFQVAFFFHTERRKQDAYGIVPLGRHTAFGMIVPKLVFRKANYGEITEKLMLVSPHHDGSVAQLNPTLAQLTRQYKESGVKIIGDWWSTDQYRPFVTRLAKTLLNESGATIHIRGGFVQADMFIDILREDENPGRLLSGFNSAVRILDSGDESHFPFMPQWIEGHASLIPLDRDQLSRSIALFDLGNIQTVIEALAPSSAPPALREKVTDNYYVFLIRHGLDVPIGIGFSLPMLPFLLHRDTWEQRDECFLYEYIRRAAFECYVSEADLGEKKARELFAMIGMEIYSLPTPGERGKVSLPNRPPVLAVVNRRRDAKRR